MYLKISLPAVDCCVKTRCWVPDVMVRSVYVGEDSNVLAQRLHRRLCSGLSQR